MFKELYDNDGNLKGYIAEDKNITLLVLFERNKEIEEEALKDIERHAGRKIKNVIISYAEKTIVFNNNGTNGTCQRS